MAPGKEPPSKPPEPAEIESQLDDLLAQIAKAEPDLLTQPAPAVRPSASAPATPAAAVSPAPVDEPLAVQAAADDEAASDESNHKELTPQAIEDQLAAVAQVLGKTPEEVSRTAKAASASASKKNEELPADQQQAMDDLLAAVTAAVKDMPATAKPVKPVMPAQAAVQPAQPKAAAAAAPSIDDEPVVAASQIEEDHLSDSQAAVPADASQNSDATDAAGDALGLDLASQIQQLLDDARTQEAAGNTFTPAEDDDQQDADLDAMPATQAAATAKPEAVDALTAADEPGMNIDAIDQMLADGADEAVVGDFETINEVLAAEPAKDEVTQAATEPVDVAAVAASAAHAASASEAAPAMEAAEDEEEIDGSFETPTEILTASALEADAASEKATVDAAALSADAQAVGRELDEQPELKAKQATAGKAAPAVDTAAAAIAAKSSKLAGLMAHLPAALAAIKAMPAYVQQACLMINRPLLGLSPQTRDLVGYAGLITVFWGSVTIVGKVVFAMIG